MNDMAPVFKCLFEAMSDVYICDHSKDIKQGDVDVVNVDGGRR